AIEQKTVSKNPRSTVGTVTEIHDFLRLLYARAADAFSLETGEPMVRYTDDQIAENILSRFEGQKLLLLSPMVRGRKGHYRELFEQIMRLGYLRARVDGQLVELESGYKVDRYKVHDIEAVVDRIVVRSQDTERILKSVQTALSLGKGAMAVMPLDGDTPVHFSRNLMCPTTGLAYPEPEPNLFSFNSPYGACPTCNGLGKVAQVDPETLFPDPSVSVKKGGIAPLGKLKDNLTSRIVEAILASHNLPLTTAVGKIPEEVMGQILYGTDRDVKLQDRGGIRGGTVPFEGLVAAIVRSAEKAKSIPLRRWARSFMHKVTCPTCNGARLKATSLQFRLGGRDIGELGRMDLYELASFLEELEPQLTERQAEIARAPLKEVRARLGFLLDVGLGYLSLDRPTRSISGGEAQRIRLATQIGSRLTEVLYILDGPSIGLHQRDNRKLIDSLCALRDAGNSVIVVEHDEDMMLASDHLVDIGPGAGVHGGQIVVQGPPQSHLDSDSITAQYLNGVKTIAVPKKRRKGHRKNLILKGATGHNLKQVNVKIPLGCLVGVSGVSGSGKSSLINQTLLPALLNHLHDDIRIPLPHKAITGLQHIDKCIAIDQSPIGRTPRSNPATYTGLMDLIRTQFALLPEAKIRGYKKGRFSFNVAGGRCESCKGAGVRTVEMNFLPDVHVPCETCQGKRFNRETLEVRYRGKSIADVLAMTVDDAHSFFEAIPKIHRITSTLQAVGLGYITLGQQSTTLSGGEAQRVKLASELARVGTGSTLYILDEPTTGLHFKDVQLLIDVLHKLVDQGNTVVVIEHNLDVLKVCDHLIDIGPEGGKDGGALVAAGTPEQVAEEAQSHTGRFLKELLAKG
ncbi:MAG: excinuclease ABC subunit UvrA, partial [Bacteroidota bacterium]|nr:excinuclease ABC subunit UvrA [Bacteroidota bacterium]